MHIDGEPTTAGTSERHGVRYPYIGEEGATFRTAERPPLTVPSRPLATVSRATAENH